MNTKTLLTLIQEEIIPIALEAGEAMLEIYARDFEIETKSDNSPLTEADQKSHQIIVKGLKQLNTQYPILSEEAESADYSERKDWETFWLVDPLDGTKEFIKKNGEFTVNIALIHEGIPIAGVVFAPYLEELYYGVTGEGAWKNDNLLDKRFLASTENQFKVVASRSHMNDDTKNYINSLKETFGEPEIVSRGSSLKLCQVAEGDAQVYPRLGPTMEWDTGAADAVVRASGGQVLRYPEMTPLDYNKENLLNPYFIVVQAGLSLNN